MKIIMKSNNYRCCINQNHNRLMDFNGFKIKYGAYYGNDKKGVFVSYGRTYTDKQGYKVVEIFRLINDKWIKRRERITPIKRDINKINGAYWKKCSDKKAIAVDYIAQYQEAKKWFAFNDVKDVLNLNPRKKGKPQLK